MTSIACCAGFVDEGTPQGKIEVYDKIPCYITRPNNDQQQQHTLHPHIAVIVATDVFGFSIPNTRLIADSYAKEGGVIAVVPDLFEGKEPPADLLDTINSLSDQISIFLKIYGVLRLIWYFIPFIIRVTPQDGVNRIEKVIHYLKTNHGITHVAVQGYCWGGRIAVNLAQKDDLIDVYASAHPGGLSLPKDIEGLKKPGCFVLPEKDFEIKEKQVALIRDILTRKDEERNEKDPEVKKARQDAFQTSLDYFKKVLNF
eukprot:gene10649-11596_t